MPKRVSFFPQVSILIQAHQEQTARIFSTVLRFWFGDTRGIRSLDPPTASRRQSALGGPAGNCTPVRLHSD